MQPELWPECNAKSSQKIQAAANRARPAGSSSLTTGHPFKDRRSGIMLLVDGAFAHHREDQEVEKVHEAKDQEDPAYFRAQDFKAGFETVRCGTEFQSEGH